MNQQVLFEIDQVDPVEVVSEAHRIARQNAYSTPRRGLTARRQRRMKAPVKYFGGKGMMLNTLINLFPQDSAMYIEPYGGAGSVLLAKPRHAVEIYNDLENNIYTLFKVLTDPGLFIQFRQLCELSIYCQSLSDEYRVNLRGADLELVQRAHQFWYVNHTRYNGIGGFSINPVIRRRMSKSTSDFLASVDGLPALHERLSTVIVSNQDALALLERYDDPETFFYLDPPYVQSTRGNTRYTVDADDDHHIELVDRVLTMYHAKVMISGYDHPIYEPLVNAGWHRKAFSVKTTDNNNERKTETEVLWMNYQTQRRMFDDEPPLTAG